MGRKTLDVLSVAAALVVMVIIMYVSSSLIDGRFYEEDVQTSWEEITDSFYRWEFNDRAKQQQEFGEVEFHDEVKVFSLSNVSGPIRISGWEKPYALVSYDKSGVDDAFVNDVYAEVVKRNGRIEAATHYRPNVPGVTGYVGYTVYVPDSVNEILVHTISGSVQMESVPEHTAVTVTMVSSDVSVQGAQSLRVRGYSGSVNFSLSGGSVKIDVSSASVRGTFSQLLEDQNISVRTTVGNIGMEFPGDLNNVTYSVRTERGTIYLSPSLAEFKRFGPVNEAVGTIGASLHSIQVESAAGDISLRLEGEGDDLMSIDQLDIPEEATE